MNTNIINYLDIASKNPDNQVILAYNSGGVEGNLTLLSTGDVDLSTGNSWETPLEGMFDISGTFEKGVAIAKQGSNFTTQMKSYRETVKYYKGSQSLDLQIDGILIATSINENLNRKIDPLLDLTNPDFDINAGLLKSLSLSPPLNYSSNPAIPDGKVAIQLGRWFRSTRVYLLVDASVKRSKASLPNGTPLYYEVNLKLTPFRMLSVSEVKQFLL